MPCLGILLLFVNSDFVRRIKVNISENFRRACQNNNKSSNSRFDYSNFVFLSHVNSSQTRAQAQSFVPHQQSFRCRSCHTLALLRGAERLWIILRGHVGSRCTQRAASVRRQLRIIYSYLCIWCQLPVTPLFAMPCHANTTCFASEERHQLLL